MVPYPLDTTLGTEPSLLLRSATEASSESTGVLTVSSALCFTIA
jgi:hypothetical protein